MAETDDRYVAEVNALGQALYTVLVKQFQVRAVSVPVVLEAVLQLVERVCSRKLAWSMSASTEQLCQGLLLALVHQRPAALDYARTLLAGSGTGDL